MGLGFGLERGSVKPEDLEKARKMVPRALEQYVTQLAEQGPGALSTAIPKVSSPRVLREATSSESVEAPVLQHGSGSHHHRGAIGGTSLGSQSDHDTDSEVDIN